ncbi:8-oxo-dGTP diphosphatase [Geodermatophilus pulveris]|uniref:8-oxo-dGTP diphosphatase n=1 Tax=Geodermatophilus pulveris TaxID=1564159 RepID=A0A239BD46_9ACTN|nr:bifunctional NUDIX hydrolase/histidine phosphatase family protein [Geodermatophilus pulveris]SNS05766.1 8-oxo-dGTP diphosphatase [Geodermatophilus pulveris]
MPGEPGGPVRAAGGALWRPTAGGGIETALVHRPRYDDWSLPKGKPEAGEHLLQTAVREVAEETGLQVVVGRRSLRTQYRVPEGSKLVDYWVMRVVGGGFEPNREVDELRWLPVDRACALVTHPHDRAVLVDLARTDVPRQPALLLVRHGKAGSKADWDGPDELRPLEPRGRQQAQRLAEVLPLFGPTAVLSARRTRCRDTVAPLAQRLGLTVEDLPELGEEEFAADPPAALATLQRLLEPAGRDGRSGPTVVCSQGGAIPSVLLEFGVRWEGEAARPHPPAAKGSTWVLAGRPGALAADYYRDFWPDTEDTPAR